MATITPTITALQDRNTVLATWANMANGDVGAPVAYPRHADKSVQVTGTFGAGGSVAVQGSNDGANYAALNDNGGTVIAITAAAVKGVGENTRSVRPAVTAGDGTTSLTVNMLLRSTS